MLNSACPLNGGQLQSRVDQGNGGAEEPDQGAEDGQAVVEAEPAPVRSVLGVLLFQFGERCSLAAAADLVPQAVLRLHLRHLENDLCDLRTEPAGVQTRHNRHHVEQNHLRDHKG